MAKNSTPCRKITTNQKNTHSTFFLHSRDELINLDIPYKFRDFCQDDYADSDPIIRRETIVEYDDNDCTDGKVAGAVLGGGLGAAVSRGECRWWAIPLGAVVGSKIGCDAAGG